MRILCFGDSITQGFWSVEGGWVEKLRKHYDKLALEDLENNQQPEIFNLGISGDTTRNLLARIESETKARIWPDDPVVVLVAVGCNDDLFEHDQRWVTPEEFKENLEKIVALVQPLCENVVLVGNCACDESKTTPVSWGDYYYTNAELEKSEAIIGEVAKQHGLPYIPVFAEFKSKLDQGEELLADGLHPNDAGHNFLFELVQAKLKEIVK